MEGFLLKILEKLCLAVKDALIIVDSPSMQQAADTLGALSENAYDIPAEGQESIMQIIRTIANGLTAISRVIPESDILQIGKRLSVASLSLLKVRVCRYSNFLYVIDFRF